MAAGELLWRVHVVAGRLRRVSRDGVVGRTRGCWRTTAASRMASLLCVQATGDAVWLDRARLLLDAAIDRFGADDGGFLDTAPTPRPWSPDPGPDGENAAPFRSVSAAASALLRRTRALTGSARHR